MNGQPITDIQPWQIRKPWCGTWIRSEYHTGRGFRGRPLHQLTGLGVLSRDGQKSEPYASFQFSPNWFNSKYVSGNTDLSVTIILPVLDQTEPRFYPPSKNWPPRRWPANRLAQANLVFYTWQSTNANAYTQYTFGAGFPARLVPTGAIIQPPAFDFGAWLGNNATCFCIIGFLLIFMGPACMGRCGATASASCSICRREIAIEGHGIKRGLTAVEAAILLGEPLDKVMTMILFGTIKKNAAEVTSATRSDRGDFAPLPEGLNDYEARLPEGVPGGIARTRRNRSRI